MKKFILIIGIAFLPLFGLGQGVYFSLGYNLSYVSLDSLNFVIDRYNETRNFLEKDMEPMHFMDGFTINFGGGAGSVVADMGFTGRSAKSSAWGVDNSGVMTRRDFKVKMNAFQIGLGFGGNLNAEKSTIHIGFSMDVGFLKAKTRVGPKSDIRSADWNKFYSELYWGIGPFVRLQFGNPGIVVQPYYNWGIFKARSYEINKTLNPVTHVVDPDELNTSMSNFGIKLMFVIGKA